MNKLQTKLFEMFKWLVSFLEANNLTYYVVCGTMLGAVRHKGFIPWDDDIDIAMPRQDYNVLLEKLSVPIDHYVIESPKYGAKDFIYGFAKFYDINTSLTEDLRRNLTRGIYIDVFPLDGIGNTLKESKRAYRTIDRTNILLTTQVARIRKERKWWKNLAIIFGRMIPLNAHNLECKLDCLCEMNSFESSKYVGNLMSTYRTKEIMPKDFYGTPKRYSFEGLSVYGPEKYDEYLSWIFNNWRQLPPEEKRRSAHDFINIDFEKSYKDA